MAKFEGEYVCKWCRYEFKAIVQYVTNEPGEMTKGGCGSVKCPRCRNGVKPRIDAKSITEIKEKVFNHG